MTETPILETARFVLRALREGDELALFAAFSDSRMMRYWSRGPFTDVAELRTYLFESSSGRTWVAEPRAGGDAVLRINVRHQREGVAEIGYNIVPGHARQDIATECVSAVITHLLRVEGYHRIAADTDRANRASNRLLERLGFTREGHLRDNWLTHIGWRDSWLWGLLADEWQG